MVTSAYQQSVSTRLSPTMCDLKQTSPVSSSAMPRMKGAQGVCCGCQNPGAELRVTPCSCAFHVVSRWSVAYRYRLEFSCEFHVHAQRSLTGLLIITQLPSHFSILPVIKCDVTTEMLSSYTYHQEDRFETRIEVSVMW